MVTAIILAAGCSTRLGSLKQLLSFRGRPLIRLVTENVLKAKVDKVIVVVGYQAECVSELIRDLPVTIVVNPDYGEGQSTSLRAGVQAWSLLHSEQKNFDATKNGILFVLGDQPLVKSETMDILIDRFHLEGKIVLPYFECRRGNPTLFGEQYLPELLALTGDTGARDIIRRHPHQVVRVDVTDPGICQDIDTWEDYLNLE